MGRRTDRARTPGLWIAANELPTTGGHPFYQRLNQVLDAHGFDAFVESQCAPFYADGVGRPSLTPGTYFRLASLSARHHQPCRLALPQILHELPGC